jgi:hypothetical protein
MPDKSGNSVNQFIALYAGRRLSEARQVRYTRKKKQ